MPEQNRGTWHIPFRGRNHSGPATQNFLWQSGNVYVMDNHRAAMWCWLRHIRPGAKHSLFHIDRHTDTLQSRLESDRQHYPANWHDLTIDEYLALSFPPPEDTLPLIRWDTYLSIYLDVFGKQVDGCIFATHQCGDKPNLKSAMDVPVWDVPDNIDYWIEQHKNPWIMNIDIDYFFAPMDFTTIAIQMISDVCIKHCMDVVRAKMDDGSIAVTTICLTPEPGYTGGWAQSERIMELMLDKLGVRFKLPP